MAFLTHTHLNAWPSGVRFHRGSPLEVHPTIRSYRIDSEVSRTALRPPGVQYHRNATFPGQGRDVRRRRWAMPSWLKFYHESGTPKAAGSAKWLKTRVRNFLKIVN